MPVLNEDNFSTVLADRQDQKTVLRTRSKDYVERKVRKAEFSKPDDGWYVLDDSLKRDIKLAKKKPQDEVFEDAVWSLLSRLGFKFLSRDRHCQIRYDEQDGASQQIDVLAVDDECAVIVECRSCEGPGAKAANFKGSIYLLDPRRRKVHKGA